MDQRNARWFVSGAVALALVGGGAAFAMAAAAGDDDRPLTGSDLERATRAALEHTGGGAVVETEVGDDGAAYGVEVRLAGGTVVEIALDEGFEVIGEESDEDDASEREDGPADN
jgi:hypothetical protein